MSTILDALKKSEQERKLRDIPTLADIPAPEERPVISWRLVAGVLMALLACLALVWLAWQFYTRAAQPSSADQIVVDNDTVGASQLDNQGLLVTVISWSEQPAQRFAIINSKVVREDQFLRPGVKVDQIKRESVVLIDRGKRMELGL